MYLTIIILPLFSQVPQPTIQPFVDRTVVVGSSPMIYCNASGVNLMYIWLLTNSSDLINIETDTVTVLNITTSVSGVLSCTVTDPMGQRATATIHLEVQGKYNYYCASLFGP